MGVAQKTTFSIDSSANSKRGDSGALIEYFRSGIGFITILPIFSLKTTSFPWPIISRKTKTSVRLFVVQIAFLRKIDLRLQRYRAAIPGGYGGIHPPNNFDFLPIAGNSLIFFHHAGNEKYLGYGRCKI